MNIDPETARRISEISDTNLNRELFWFGAWDTGNGDVSPYVDRDLAIIKSERRAQKGRD